MASSLILSIRLGARSPLWVARVMAVIACLKSPLALATAERARDGLRVELDISGKAPEQGLLREGLEICEVLVERVARNAGVSQHVIEAKLVGVLLQQQRLGGIEQLDPNGLAAGLFGLLLAQRHHVVSCRAPLLPSCQV